MKAGHWRSSFLYTVWKSLDLLLHHIFVVSTVSPAGRSCLEPLRRPKADSPILRAERANPPGSSAPTLLDTLCARHTDLGGVWKGDSAGEQSKSSEVGEHGRGRGLGVVCRCTAASAGTPACQTRGWGSRSRSRSRWRWREQGKGSERCRLGPTLVGRRQHLQQVCRDGALLHHGGRGVAARQAGAGTLPVPVPVPGTQGAMVPVSQTQRTGARYPGTTSTPFCTLYPVVRQRSLWLLASSERLVRVFSFLSCPALLVRPGMLEKQLELPCPVPWTSCTHFHCPTRYPNWT